MWKGNFSKGPSKLHSNSVQYGALTGLRDVLRAPQAALDLWGTLSGPFLLWSLQDTISYFIYISTQLLPLEEGFSRFPISKAHLDILTSAITSLHPFIPLYFFCSIFQLPFHYILCLLSSVNTVYCLRSSFTEPAAPASCSLLTPSTCQGTTTWEACSEYLLNKWMIVEQSRDCNPRLSASKIHALFHSTTQNSKAHSSVAVTSLSVQFSRSVVSESLRPHGLQHARPLCPSPTPGAYSNSCPSSQWCHPTISTSVVPVSSCPQSFPASWSFPMSQFFISGGQSIGISASASVLPVNIQDWFPLGLTG